MSTETLSPQTPYLLDPAFENLDGSNRYERALIILQGVNNIRKANGGWLVKSQGSPAKYFVSKVGEKYVCNCPDCVLHHNECKHILAVKMSLEAQKPRVSKQTRNWSEYNIGLCDEFRLFDTYLKELIGLIELPEQENRRGRKSLPLDEVIYATITKVAHQLSSRRGQGVIDADSIGDYNYTATTKFLQNPDNSALLRELLHATAKPLVQIEESFSIDASGFSTRCYHEWCSEKWGTKRTRDFVKCHIVTGNKSNIVTDAVITDSSVADTSMFEELLNETAGTFNVKQFLADAGYLSNENYKKVAKIHADALIMFKKDSGVKGKCNAWRNAFLKFIQTPDDFYAEYWKRNNVETTFGAIKAKYGETLKSKILSAQINELYCKLIAYNISVIIKFANLIE